MTALKLTTLACLGIVTSGSALAGPVPATADDGGPRNWVVSASTAVNLREKASPAARVLTRYAPGTVLDNVGGCAEADGYPPFSATKDGDLNMIKVGAERYEIPDAAVLGG